ncbi:hypothetical protein Barb7_01379 [Bacteroidales bacterium Barb7]|nr:hypothetical protein Barb7_01379 [Bacteroidales bacterium Barb7]
MESPFPSILSTFACNARTDALDNGLFASVVLSAFSNPIVALLIVTFATLLATGCCTPLSVTCSIVLT